uniref:Tc1-like transposase DDE domain-containing protein n=1 Tax=Amphiprion ocellaris TaxID=80972 RepID=A0A3Q1AX10_AMPOC
MYNYQTALRYGSLYRPDQNLKTSRQTAAGYVQMLQQASLMTEGPRLCGNSWVFQQDNTAVHNARLTKDFFRENNITLLDHPTCSPDLNPIENIWGWMILIRSVFLIPLWTSSDQCCL